MSRYIDADVLIRYGKCGTLVYWEDIEDASSIDIVRCKECKNKDNIVDYCHKTDRWVTADDFCSYGVRKESE